MDAFWLSLGMIFLAELGDKTQLVALTLATRFNARVVLAGVFVATLLVHLVSVGLGGAVGSILPRNWIQFISGLAFLGFGIWTLRGDSVDDEETGHNKYGSAFMLVAVTFFLAELGDKTMISTVTLATKGSVWMVWLGSTMGMVLSDGLAIWVGQILGKRLPERPIKIGASCIFFGYGIISMILGRAGIPLAAWGIGIALTGIMAFIFLRQPKDVEEYPVKTEKSEAAP